MEGLCLSEYLLERSHRGNSSLNCHHIGFEVSLLRLPPAWATTVLTYLSRWYDRGSMRWVTLFVILQIFLSSDPWSLIYTCLKRGNCWTLVTASLFRPLLNLLRAVVLWILSFSFISFKICFVNWFLSEFIYLLIVDLAVATWEPPLLWLVSAYRGLGANYLRGLAYLASSSGRLFHLLRAGVYYFRFDLVITCLIWVIFQSFDWLEIIIVELWLNPCFNLYIFNLKMEGLL